MASTDDSTPAPAIHGPVTAALYAMRTEPEPAPSGRRLFLRALAALPAIGAVVGAASPALAAPAPSDAENEFLALVPWFMRVVPPAERARKHAKRLYAEGEDAAGPHPGWTIPAVARDRALVAAAARREAGYFEAFALAAELEAPIAEAFEPFREAPMTTLPALAWKARIDRLFGGDGQEVATDLAALAGWVVEAA